MRADRRGVLLKKVVSFLMTHHPRHAFLPSSAVPFRFVAGASDPPAAVAMGEAAGVLQKKRALRSQIRRALKVFSPAQREQEAKDYVCNFDTGRYIPVRQVADTRTAHYWTVPQKIDRRQSIEGRNRPSAVD
ncbi:hypothetical protein BHM03_00004819 [Ensete ventricosum]|nr:hypothetical protein BHM03_00004819 [Ensete ventricosum]